MFNLIKDVINKSNFELTNILKKIDTQWIENKISDEERAELIKSAQDKANFKNSLDMYAKVLEIDKEIKELKDKVLGLEELIKTDNVGDTETDIETPEDATVGKNTTEGENTEIENDTIETVTYPEFEVGKWYYAGDIVSFEGKNYKCIAPNGVVCVWSPKDYAPYWELLVENESVMDEIETNEPTE